MILSDTIPNVGAQETEGPNDPIPLSLNSKPAGAVITRFAASGFPAMVNV